jgi:hypothetical protein
MLALLFKKLEPKAILANISMAIVAQTLLQVILILVMSPKLHRYSPEKMLDLRFIYTFSEITRYFTELGIEGRRLYILTEIIDLIYPFAYTAAFILLIIYLGKYAHSPVQITKNALVVPVLLFVFDYLENLSIIAMLGSFPDENFLYHIAGYITLIKYCLLLFNVILITIFAITAIKKEFL